MGVFFFLIGLFIFLLVYTMISSIIKVSLYLTTKHSYSNIRIFIPTILTLLVIVLLSIFLLFSINKFTGRTLYEILFDYILKVEGTDSYFNILFPFVIVYIIFIIILQSFTYLCVNIDLNKIWNNIRFKIKKLFKILPKEDVNMTKIDISQSNIESIESKVTNYANYTVTNSQIALEKEKENINFTSALVASLFTFCFTLFSIIVFLIIGFILSDKIPLN